MYFDVLLTFLHVKLFVRFVNVLLFVRDESMCKPFMFIVVFNTISCYMPDNMTGIIH